jgi:hypothetical protein
MGVNKSYYITCLSDELRARKNINPDYSLRAFADWLKIDASYLSKCLARKQVLSLAKAERIIKKMGLTENERKLFLRSIANHKTCDTLKKHDKSLTDCSD